MSARVIAPDVSAKSLAELFSFRGRRVVVTGGARGIGLAIARRLAEAGAAVYIGDINREAAEQAAQALAEEFGGEVRGLYLDVQDPSSVDAFTAEVLEGGGGIDHWVNNAAIYPTGSLADSSHEQWSKIIDVDLTGVFYCCQAAVHAMSANGDSRGGVIVNMSSVSGLRGRAGIVGYVAAKHGVSGLTKALALEVADRGIRVMAVAPSVVDTEGMREIEEALPPEQRRAREQFLQGLVDAIPLGRQAVPDDVARMVVFCLSDMCAWMTGTVLAVDGGLTAK